MNVLHRWCSGLQGRTSRAPVVDVAVLVECWDSSQFVRVRDQINLPDLSIEHLQCQKNSRHTIAIQDHSRLPIDEGDAETGVLRSFSHQAQEIARHCMRARDRMASRRNLPTAISIAHAIVGKQAQKTIHIAIQTSAEKLVQHDLMLLLGSRIQRVPRSQVLTHSAHDLTTIVLAILPHRRAGSVSITTALTTQEDDAA